MPLKLWFVLCAVLCFCVFPRQPQKLGQDGPCVLLVLKLCLVMSSNKPFKDKTKMGRFYLKGKQHFTQFWYSGINQCLIFRYQFRCWDSWHRLSQQLFKNILTAQENFMFIRGDEKKSSSPHFAPFLVQNGKQTCAAVNKMKLCFSWKGHLVLNIKVITRNR